MAKTYTEEIIASSIIGTEKLDSPIKFFTLHKKSFQMDK